MYDQIRGDALYIMLYAVVATMAMMASCYLLFRRGNAFAPEITPPVRLRRWTAAFFASLFLNHLWYMPIIFLTSNEGIETNDLIGGLLDSVTIIPLALVTLFCMLQDRRRPLWPIAVMMAPIVVVGTLGVVSHSYALLPILYVYFLVMCVGIIIYMVRALRQYGRWLRDNYADLEHKEVWQSFVVLAIIMLVFAIYAFASEGVAYQYAMQVIIIVLICYLLWRVETLSDLMLDERGEMREESLLDSATQKTINPLSQRLLDEGGEMRDERGEMRDERGEMRDERGEKRDDGGEKMDEGSEMREAGLSGSKPSSLIPLPSSPDDCDTSKVPHGYIGQLLQQHCIDTQLYLKHDLSIHQLAKTIGTNRLYLSQYFSQQGITYNTYINNLRVNHFMKLYREAVATQRPFTAQQLAGESGYHSYSTFGIAFKQRMGMTVTAWMREIVI